MSLPLTPQVLAAAYEYLRACAPFKAWRLPHSDTIAFRVIKGTTCYGVYEYLGERKWISVSKALVGHSSTLLSTMAHEMVHLYQHVEKRDTRGVIHNAHFRRTARRICQLHGWDPMLF